MQYTHNIYYTFTYYVQYSGCPGIDSVPPINRDEIHLSNLHRYPSLIHLLLLNGDGDLYQIAAKFDQPEAPPSTADDDDVYYTNTDDNPSNNMPSNLNITDPNDDYDTYYHDDKLTAAGVYNTENSVYNTQNSVYNSKRILTTTTSSTSSTTSTATSTTLSGASAANYGMNRLGHAKKLFHEARDRTSTSDIPSPITPPTTATTATTSFGSGGFSAALLSSAAAVESVVESTVEEEEKSSEEEEVVAKKPARVQYGRSEL